ncbi:hypothetical protein [Succinivibrio dextrinosolvens]|uniref:Uncharacterized protein n=1 Tax=Succinivibrio dextrinosolvens TaxID=83771 RepID=A0A662ZAF6_9GAMM|nr:hypothetical protein [Succinivibrio dextrinosolvens]SFJ83401.1 hypothetical protein SAMN04487865_10044 [Succinivibrio dextrinosolvens]
MNTKLKSINFSITPEINEGQAIFPSYSVYEFSLKEGISDLYYGKLFFYATNSLKASELQQLIGKMVNIEIEISDNLHAPNKDKHLKQDYSFKRLVNGLISSVKFLGKTMDVTTKVDNKPANIFEIDFASPFELLKENKYQYHDLTHGKLQDKLEVFLNKPEKVVFGEDYKYNSYLSIKYELLESKDKNLSSLPDNVCIQIGNYTPLHCLKKLLTDFGLNFNIIHADDNGKKIIKVFLSKGYGVSKSNGVTSSYFDNGNSDKLNYDIEIVCDQSDSGSPKLTSFSIDVNTQNLGNYDNNNEFLLYSTTTDKNAIASKTDSEVNNLTNLNNKTDREKMIYRLTSSHLIFVPGSVIKAQNYIDSEVKLIVDNVDLHVLAGLNGALFNSSKKHDPSIEETISAYEVDQNREPGSFADFVEIEDKTAAINKEIAVHAETNSIRILEAIVTDGQGNYSGNWPAPSDDPSLTEPLEGSICICAGDNTKKPSLFYALPWGMKTPVQVQLTSTIENTDLFNIPRIGQKILILSGNNNYYLHSFLSQKDSSPVSEADKGDRNNKLAAIKALASRLTPGRVHVWDATDNSKNTAIKGYQVDETKFGNAKLALEKNADIKQYVKNQILDGTESALVEALNLQDNTYKYYQDYSGTKAISANYLGGLTASDCDAVGKSSIKERCEAIKNLYLQTKNESEAANDALKTIEKEIKTKNNAKKVAEAGVKVLKDKDKKNKEDELKDINSDIQSLTKKKTDAEKTQKEKNKAFNNAEKGLEAITNEFIGEIGYPDDTVQSFNDVFKIDHDGNLEINAKGTVTIKAKTINISSSKTTALGGSGSITMTSPGSIKMGCAGTTFSLAPSSMKACSMPFANGSLASFGSTLSLDAFEGTSVKAPMVNITGKFAAAVKDGVGAGFKVSKGVSGLSGNETSMATTTLPKAMLSVVKFDEDLVSELGNTIAVNVGPNASKYEKGILDGVLFPVLNEAMGVYVNGNVFTNYFYGKWDEEKQERKGGVAGYKDKRYNATDGTNTKVTEAENKVTNASTPAEKKAAENELKEAKDADSRTVCRFVVDTCDFICDALDLISKAMGLVNEIWKMANEDGNWFEKKGHVGKNNAQDIKYIFASLKYTLNTVAIHAVVGANVWGLKPAKVAVSGGAITISSTTKSDKVITEVKARPVV